MNNLRSFKAPFATLGILFTLTTVAPQAGFAQATVLTGNVSTAGRPQAFTNQVNLDDRYAPDTKYAGGTSLGNSLMSAPAARAFQNAPPLRSSAGLSTGVQRQPRPLVRTVYVRDNRTFFERHPKVKAASIGAGVGAGAGALTGLVTGRGMMRGALIGGGTGAGVGLVRSSTTMKRHPIMRDVATGGLVGLGLGAAGSRYHRTTLEATGLGAALGLGVGMYKHMR